MIRSLNTLFRLVKTAFILARCDALSTLKEKGLIPGRTGAFAVAFARFFSKQDKKRRSGQKLALALVELGPSYVKLGQFLSTRADLLGDELAADLSALQDQLPPFSPEEARRVLEQELGQKTEDLFDHFDFEAISAASIAQVHFATTPDGQEVAVKILRPSAQRAFQQDINFFRHLAALLEKSRPNLKRFRLQEVVETFAEMVRHEMDLRMEAAAACELAENFIDDKRYVTPKVHWELTRQRVLTMTRVTGIPMDDRDALLSAGHDLREVLKTAAEIFFNQVFRDGFFHGDQHPGNMLVGGEGQIVAVDFGIMGRMDRQTRYFLADMLLALLEGDYLKLAVAHRNGRLIGPDVPLGTFAQALRSVCQPVIGKSLESFSFAQLLGRMFHLTSSFDMKVQPQLLLLQKNMVMAEGISRQLDQSFNIWTVSRPMIECWMVENRGPKARLRESVKTAGRSLEKLPQLIENLDKMAGNFAHGSLKLSGETLADFGKGSSNTARWPFVLALFALGFAVGSYF